MKRAILALLTLVLTGTGLLHAQELLAVLEASLVVESRLLDADLERYAQARQREQETKRRHEARSRQLDGALVDQSVAVEELRRMEAELAAAREAAVAASRDVAELRRQLYLRMERMEELGREIERQRDRSLVVTSSLDGLWRIEMTPVNEFGILKLRVENALVSGSYRLSSGEQGSIRGTMTANTLRIDRLDAKRGLVASLEGEFDPSAGELSGRWTAVDVSGGAPGGGEWTARKLSPAEEESLRVE